MSPTLQASDLDVEGLVAQADALLALDADNKLVPHGIGGLARDLIGRLASALEAAEANLAAANKQIEEMRGALEPFVAAFEYRRSVYSLRYESPQLGLANFDKMPDSWPIEKAVFRMGDFRRARTALSHEAHNG